MLKDLLPDIKLSPRVIGVLLVIVAMAVVCLCWQLWKPAAPVAEKASVAKVQADGSVVLAKAPDATARPKQLLPVGTVAERIVQVSVRPKAVTKPSLKAAAAAKLAIPVPFTPGKGATLTLPQVPSFANTDVTSAAKGALTGGDGGASVAVQGDGCPPVTLDLTLARFADGTRAVVVSSPDGEVVGGVDIPVENAVPPPSPKLWAAGLTFNPFHRTAGLAVDRDFDPQGWLGWTRIGAEINQSREGSLSNPDFRINAKIRF